MDSFIAYTLTGIFTGAAYAIAASGLVLTYSTTRVFNIAHGAFGMLLAFVYWDFSRAAGHAGPGWPCCWCCSSSRPLLGVLVQRFLARGLGEAPVGVVLVVTVGLLVALIGVAQQIWPPAVRAVTPFFAETRLQRLRHLHHAAPGHHDPAVRRRGRRPLPAAQPHPDRRGDAGLGRQPRAPQAVRRPPRRRGRAGLGDRHLAGRPRRHPARADDRPAVLRPDAAGHQRLRRRDARPAEEPAAGVRRRDGARHHAGLHRRLPAQRQRPRRPARRRADAVPLRGHRADAPGPAADRPGQGADVGAGADRPSRAIGAGVALLVGRRPAHGRDGRLRRCCSSAPRRRTRS